MREKHRMHAPRTYTVGSPKCAAFRYANGLQCRKIHKIRWIKIKNWKRNTHVKSNFNYLSRWNLLNFFFFQHFFTSNSNGFVRLLERSLNLFFFSAVIAAAAAVVVLLFKYWSTNCKMWQIWLNIHTLYMEYKIACYSCDTSCNSIPFSHSHLLILFRVLLLLSLFAIAFLTTFLPSSLPLPLSSSPSSS